jgi:hypothetical protein
MKTIVILDDGETWSTLQGAELLSVSDEGERMLAEGVAPRDIPERAVILSIMLTDTTGRGEPEDDPR